MIIAGADCQTRTGFAINGGDRWRALSFHARAKRPAGLGGSEISIEYEAEIAEEYRDFFRTMLLAEGVEHVGIEEPRTRDYGGEEIVVDTETEWAGKAIKRIPKRRSNNLAMVRGLIVVGQLIGVCKRLNIPTKLVSGDDWRESFLGFSRAPGRIKGAEARRKWLKEMTVRQCALAGIDVPNDDAADAVGVAWWLRGWLNPLSARRVEDLFAGEKVA